ncbi:YraN family protein [Helicobacter sp. MIT 11-5569]|uniref:YraN family protein n=1 Tax=Helicobacter sp. MIT 11-5569 TaxID=1548151 RepID=UPI00051FE555|nr:YraN family protein [Helicobacter sp. MIT 11-5569]TLD80659.1 YraN family protein [Helicobacter sp. MIT 11-5569]
MKNNTTQKGREAEDYACVFLQKEGYTILERNFNTKLGEIDIIAKKDGILHFIEVKSGIGFEPIYNISPKKLDKLSKTLNIYLKANHINLPYCLSALILSKKIPSDSFNVNFIENITLF